MSYHLPDAPAIRAAERFGTEEPEDCCPICGALCDKVYRFSDGRPAGCEDCWGLFPGLGKER